MRSARPARAAAQPARARQPQSWPSCSAAPPPHAAAPPCAVAVTPKRHRCWRRGRGRAALSVRWRLADLAEQLAFRTGASASGSYRSEEKRPELLGRAFVVRSATHTHARSAAVSARQLVVYFSARLVRGSRRRSSLQRACCSCVSARRAAPCGGQVHACARTGSVQSRQSVPRASSWLRPRCCA